MAAILVTGASTGIGEACALHLDRAGHRVFAGVRRPADGERLTKRASPRLLPVMLDVCDDSQIAEAAELIGGEVGTAGLWGLVNNAGIAIGGPVEFLALDQWRTQLEVNVIGQVAVTRAMLPLVRAATGRVVFIGSISGRLATPMMGPYCASKHAIEAIGSSLAEELRPFGMRVSVIEPGAIATPMSASMLDMPDVMKYYLDRIALHRIGELSELAATVAFLLSDDASYVTSATLLVDAGFIVNAEL